VLSLFIRAEVFFAAFASFAVKSRKKGRVRGAAHVEEFEKNVLEEPAEAVFIPVDFLFGCGTLVK